MNNPHDSSALQPVIVADTLGKTYTEGGLKTRVFEDLHLEVQQGETVAIVGPSGAGKSTLLHLLGGLDMPTVGEVRINGQVLSKLSDSARSRLRNQSLGVVYQFHHLLAEFTALENTMLPVLLSNYSVTESYDKAVRLLEAVDLGHRLHHKPSELSGGERQRAAVARALVNDPSCVLGDEPTGNLDAMTAGKVFDTLLTLNRAKKTSLILVTHDRQLAKRLDRVVELHQGRLRVLAHADV